jgi:predicted PurR-regulated permease PerM
MMPPHAKAGSVLILIGMAFFVAAGLEPVVSWLTRHHVPRWAGVVIVIAGMLGIAAIFLALAIPRLTAEATTLAHALPTYLHRLQNHNSELGKLNAKYHLEQRLQNLVSGHGTSLAGRASSLRPPGRRHRGARPLMFRPPAAGSRHPCCG